MAWCTKCKSEYEPHVKRCAECGEALIDKLEENIQHEIKIEIQSENKVLINVASSIEADLIIARLESDSIPAFKGYQSSGQYLNIASGFNYQGIDIYVPKELYDQASEIISEEQNNLDASIEDDEDKELDRLSKKYNTWNRNKFRLLIFIFMIVPLILTIITKVNDKDTLEYSWLEQVKLESIKGGVEEVYNRRIAEKGVYLINTSNKKQYLFLNGVGMQNETVSYFENVRIEDDQNIANIYFEEAYNTDSQAKESTSALIFEIHLNESIDTIGLYKNNEQVAFNSVEVVE